MKLANFDFSKKNIYHPDRVAEHQAGGRPYPVTVDIDLTNRCNHKCSFCFYAEHISADKSTLDPEVIKNTLTKLHEEAEAFFDGAPTNLLTSAYAWHQGRLEEPKHCYAHYLQIAILAESHVAFCKNARGANKFYIGNIYDKSFKEIWNDERNKSIEAWVKPSNCGLYCKHIRMNLALEHVLNPHHDMSPNFVG